MTLDWRDSREFDWARADETGMRSTLKSIGAWIGGWKLIVLMIVSLSVLGGCSTGQSIDDQGALEREFGEGQTGVASWYGEAYHGRPTASGERFNMNDYTAAHRTLPFGTRVEVKNMKNRRTVVVRINDRGPYVRGRVIDLSRAAATKLEIMRDGVATVQLTVVDD